MTNRLRLINVSPKQTLWTKGYLDIASSSMYKGLKHSKVIIRFGLHQQLSSFPSLNATQVQEI